jgi:hypothetical protein
MKAKTMTMLGLLALSSFSLALPSVAADCEVYGNLVNVGSSYTCTARQQYCDQTSGAGAGAGAGGAGGGQAGAKAGTTTDCTQGNGNYAVDLPVNLRQYTSKIPTPEGPGA